MASGGARARSGSPPDPLSRKSLLNGREFISLALAHDVKAPAFPLEGETPFESVVWAALWVKPQAVMWDRLGLGLQVAAYTRALAESVLPEASAGLKTAVLRMETELGISTSGMLQNGWMIAADDGQGEVKTPNAKKKRTPTGNWLEAVKVVNA